MGYYNLAEEPFDVFFSRFHRRIKALSLSDNNGLRDMHSPLGSGNINWQSIKSMINQLNWHGVIVFETKSLHPKIDYDYFNEQDYLVANISR